MMEYELGALVEPLCFWYKKNKRSMPWREASTPYHVWISEIMLQQTRIEAVMGYYARFMEKLPDVKSLSEVPEDELLKLWEGLGYYNRARNLKKAAVQVMEQYDGVLPADYEKLKGLAGIGNYTAGAIASIAYGIPAPAVDGNVLRVVMRYLNCEDDISKMSVRRRLEQSILDVIPKDIPGEFNQAIMELGEVICIPNGMPLCDECPLKESCQGRKAGRQLELPVKPEKKARRIEKKTILLLEYNGKIGIRKRHSQGLLAGMWEFPSLPDYRTETALRKELEEMGMEICEISGPVKGKHIFSHVEWHMKGYKVVLSGQPTQHIVQNIIFVEREALEREYALPVAFHGFLQS